MKKPEILAPAGSMEALKAAVHAGADAVYIGGSQFGARAYADNFDADRLLEAIEYCHLYGVKVYLTVNTLFRNEEIDLLYDYLLPLYEAGLDAVIVQDLGVMKYIHEQFADLPIHASTQMTITTQYAYQLLYTYGVTRIVPARELSIREIAQLKQVKHVPEVEVFVQGALCYCYSGQCLMSSLIGGRSGNRGRCAQPCRLPYHILGEDDIRSSGEYLLSPKDLCGLDAVESLIKAGVDSFKIEGRMKRPEYVAMCVLAYRKVVDAWFSDGFSQQMLLELKEPLAQVFNRGGFTAGYFQQKNGKNMMSIQFPGNVGMKVGTISKIHKNQMEIHLIQNVNKGDVLVVYGMQEPIRLTCNVDGVTNDHIILNIPKSDQFKVGRDIHRISNFILMENLKKFIENAPVIGLNGHLELQVGKKASLSLHTNLKGKLFSVVCTGELVQQASNRALQESVVREKVETLGNTRYSFDKLSIHMQGEVFYPLKLLKELRRTAIVKLEEMILDEDRRPIPKQKISSHFTSFPKDDFDGNKLSVLVSDEKQLNIVNSYNQVDCIYIDIQYFNHSYIQHLMQSTDSKDLTFALPPILRNRYLQELKNFIILISDKKQFGILVRNIDEFALLASLEYSGKIVIDYSLYTMNDWSVSFIRDVFPNAIVTISVELNEQQINSFAYRNTRSELIVYGHQQLMVSAQCIQNTINHCDNNNHQVILRDRYFKNFFMFSVCKYCYNVLYNGIPTVLYDLVKDKTNHFGSLRMHFTKESEKEVCMILDSFFHNNNIQFEKTRGHFNRGVE